jgi:UDP-3-O-[3-hydroxymyristoyl] glucosamine N-acyltransferase
MTAHTAQSIAEHVGGRLIGPGDLRITGLAEVARAAPGDLTFIGTKAYAEAWPASDASAALVSEDLAPEPIDGKALIVVQQPDLAMAAVLELFAPPPERPAPGIHPAAVIDPDATLGQGVSIGAHAYVGPHARIGDRCVLHHRATVMHHATLGDGCELFAGAVVGSRCTLGDRVILHANAVIGTDGFGYRPGDPAAGQPPIVKIPHLGGVRLGNDVEIGAATCIDRGKFDDTTVGDHTKIDNLVQIGHNCHIGQAVIIAGCCGISGSVTIGDGSVLGGGARIKDHITIGRQIKLAGTASVMDNIPDGETWAGEPAKPLKVAAREELALRQLPDLLKQYRKMQRGK